MNQQNAFDKRQEVRHIKAALSSAGVDPKSHIKIITNTWPKPMGFHFIPKDWRRLAKLLNLNQRFAFESPTAAHLAKLVKGKSKNRSMLSWRQVSSRSSLHVTLLKGKPYQSWKKGAVVFVNVHIDAVSVCTGRNPNGTCQYGIGNLLQHGAADLWKLPLVTPSPKNGLTLGVRF